MSDMYFAKSIKVDVNKAGVYKTLGEDVEHVHVFVGQH